jgi:glucose/mannose-6-phosphate isomerase
MPIHETILKTARQFIFQPKIINGRNLKKYSKYVVVGMGGSHLAAGLLKRWKPQLEVTEHQDYGLPEWPLSDLKKRLIILSSYSGNTEEVIDAYEKAGKMGLKRAVITVGGRLLELARKDKTAYIQMPDLGIQPREALPLSLMSFLKITGEEKTLAEISGLLDSFHPEKWETAGKDLAERLSKHIPVIYTSSKNGILGYIWKITFNETGKIPAFNNVFPELNHNEINGFDVRKTTEKLSEKFYFIMLSDPQDGVKIKKRMEVTAKLYRDRKLPVEIIELDGENKYLNIFNSIVLANFAAYFTAINYGLEAEQVPMVEEFKKLI